MSREITKGELDDRIVGMSRSEVNVGMRTVIIYSDPSTDTKKDFYSVDGRYFVSEEWLRQSQA